MSKRILLVQAHPDASRPHFGHALEASYAQGARDEGHTVRQLVVATLDFPLLRSQQEWEEGSIPPSLKPRRTTSPGPITSSLWWGCGRDVRVSSA